MPHRDRGRMDYLIELEESDEDLGALCLSDPAQTHTQLSIPPSRHQTPESREAANRP